MPIKVAVLRAMAANGGTLETILAALEAAELAEDQASEAALAKRRRENRERQQKFRASRLSRVSSVSERDESQNSAADHPIEPQAVVVCHSDAEAINEAKERVSHTLPKENIYIQNSLPLDSLSSQKISSENTRARSNGHAKAGPDGDEIFQRFWSTYPKREGRNPRKPAFKKFVALVKSGADPEAIIAGARAYAGAEHERVGTPYIAQAVTWLNQSCWEDYAPQAPPAASTGPPKPPIEGLPTDEELRARYAPDRGTTEETSAEAASVLAEGVRPCENQQPRLVHGGEGDAGTCRMGKILREPRMEAVCDQTNGAAFDQGNDDAGAMARMV